MNDKTQIKSYWQLKVEPINRVENKTKETQNPRKQKPQLNLILKNKPEISRVWKSTKND